jgi:hypothetical protein
MNHVVVLRFFAAYAHIQAVSACTLIQVPIIEVVTPSGLFQQRFVLAVNDGHILGPTVGLGAGYAHPWVASVWYQKLWAAYWGGYSMVLDACRWISGFMHVQENRAESPCLDCVRRAIG